MHLTIKPKIKGFICITAHPEGCAHAVKQQIEYVQQQDAISQGPKNVLIIGASTGYGLASRITAAFGSHAATVGVFFERPAEGNRTASAGWYNTVAFEKQAHAAGLYAKSINGDAFSNEIKQSTIKLLKEEVGQVDLVIYSLASPKRVDPITGVVHKSTLKPIGQSFESKTLDTDRKLVSTIRLEAADGMEIEDTIKVMGGEDWELWMKALQAADLLAPNIKTVAYTYIGPELTWPIYSHGTIGRAKKDLEHVCKHINQMLQPLGGEAIVSVNKAVVTQASSAIPVVPLYISLLFQVMKEKSIHEGCIEQIYRLFHNHLYTKHSHRRDDLGRIRLDDLEMSTDVQAAVTQLWPKITTETLTELSDFKGYQIEFLRLFGFGFDTIDYEEPVEVDLQLL